MKSSTQDKARWIVAASAGLAVVIGGWWLAAWLGGFAAQWSAARTSITMKTNTALGLVLAGSALLLLGCCSHRPVCRRIGVAAAAMVLLIGSLTLSERLIGWDLGIDQLLARESPGALAALSPNRMGVPASACFTLLGIGLLLLSTAPRESGGRTLGGQRIVPYLGLAVTVMMLIPAVGFLYGIDQFFTLGATSIAAPTVGAMFALGVGLILACPQSRPMSLLLADDTGGRLLRRLLPAAVLLPLVLGFLRTVGEQQGLYGPVTGRGLLVVSLIVVFALILWRSAARLSKSDREQRQAEEALRESETRFRALMTASSEVLYRMNPDWSEMRQLQGGGFISDTTAPDLSWMQKYIHPDDQERVKAAIAEAIRNRAVFELEHRVFRLDGTLGWTSSRAVPLLDDGGHIVEWFGAASDVTERKRAEADLIDARESAERATVEAEAASRSKDHFLAVLSHELRTPLTPVLPALAALETLVTAEGREFLEISRRNVELEARLIDDLLDVTRITRGRISLDRRPVDICRVIHHAADVCQPDIAARRLHFGVKVSNGPHMVNVDSARLQQVFWNLLKNAVKFTPEEGCVGVHCYRTNDGRVLVEVSDSGQGIEREALGRVFNAFEQETDRSSHQFGGLGLGLAISKALVELHGGRIEARSPGRGKGATFTVELPLHESERTEPRPGVPAPPQAVHRSLKILLVEDHGDTARVLSRLLHADGHTVKHAGAVATAVEMARAEAFDLLLSDLGLPDGSGHDLMRQLAMAGKHLPAIALSGYGMAADVQNSRDAGFADHITKPVKFSTLKQAIASAVQPSAPAAATE